MRIQVLDYSDNETIYILKLNLKLNLKNISSKKLSRL